ncbi:FKBP-type peptidyl-prolyl cis-trans isomerase [Subtercola sp. YIM 133946]|uniref:FKBP-type peptidyl-prolyl cis-trans isomerase n=1 Tax=Subtercola sp. YIM 133946 TaxID=3118909 RepID=UPI002F94B60E
MRKSVALIVATGLLVALAGCSSSSDSAAAGCTPPATAGAASDLISATTDPQNPAGTFGTAPTLTVNTPVDLQTTQVTTLIKGTGATLPAGGVVSLDYILADGTTGAISSKTPFDGSSYVIAPVSSINLPGLRTALTCATEGSRLAIAIPPSEEVDPASSTSGIPTDSVVMIVDVKGALPARADGAVQPAQAGFPSVALGPDGRPGITIPSGSVPTTASTAVLKRGDGATVAAGDGVWVQYTAVSWNTKAVTGSTWSDGSPTQVTAASDGSSKVPDLVGQTVGSQYISIVPPTVTDGSTTGDPTVYVVDVLGVTPVVSSTQ